MRKIALFDMDGTLADYDGQLLKDLNRIKSELEPEISSESVHEGTGYLEERRHIITNQAGWWLKLPKFQLGFDVFEMVKKIGFDTAILTKGPATKYHAWSEKLQWIHEKIGKEDCGGVTITHDKGLVYGSVLVDDFPDYVEAWLKFRPRGLVIMPAHSFNKGYCHPNVIRYDGTNKMEIHKALCHQYDRKREE
jgi:5'(3')-deoxyribonucleotidase